ncbi:unnamed protein product [Penicillium glandicola]
MSTRQENLPVENTQPADRTKFDVAVICALRCESDAVETIFDEFWEDDKKSYGKASKDPNSYLLGRVGQHNVVLVYMAGIGKVNSAAAAAHLFASFPNIRLGLVVGICGAMPQPTDGNTEIFLGDVIVSTGLVQHDFGRQLPNRFIRKDTINDNLRRPTSEIRSFLRQLCSRRGHTILHKELHSFIMDIYSEKGFENWTAPPREEDKLYRASYPHIHHDPTGCIVCGISAEGQISICDVALELSCEQLGCDERELELRKDVRNDLKSTEHGSLMAPKIHFGRIASGDSVMKSALHRNQVAMREGVYGFEMEGAGAWDNFPVIVVKGVCDYADSHKNKRWQNYASIVAAATAKALLCQWRGIDGTSVLSDSAKLEMNPKNKGVRDYRDDGVTFINYGRVSNQAASQTFNQSVTFH